MEIDSTTAQTEVLIAGAGPVGLALALELQRFGIQFRIVEKNAERSTTSKALGLQPRLSEVFSVLGIADKFFERVFSTVSGVNMHANGKRLLRIQMQLPPNMAGRDAFQPRLMIIPQSLTEEILEKTLAERGHLVERQRELIDFDQGDHVVRATVRDESGAEETICAKYLVGCEGAHSVVRKLAGFSFAGATFPLRFLLADVTVDWDRPNHEVQVWFHPNGSFAAIPFGDKVWRLVIECAEDATRLRPT